MKNPPIQHFYELGSLSLAGVDVTVEATGDELSALAHWAGVSEVRRFAAQVHLKRLAATRFLYDAEFEADLVQSCVVTLEPVPARIERRVHRELNVAPRIEHDAGELTLAAGDDDVPETITSLDYDLAAPILEEFVLSIDPYPRKQGAAFEPPPDEARTAESPFAVLKSLKQAP